MQDHPRAESVRTYLHMLYQANARQWKTALEHIICRTEPGKKHIAALMQRFPRSERTELLEAELCKGAASVLAAVKLKQKSDRR